MALLYNNFGNQYGWAPYYSYPPTYIVRPNNWYGSNWNTYYQQNPQYRQTFTQQYPHWRDHHSGQRYDQNFYNQHHQGQGGGWQKGSHGGQGSGTTGPGGHTPGVTGSGGRGPGSRGPGGHTPGTTGPGGRDPRVTGPGGQTPGTVIPAVQHPWGSLVRQAAAREAAVPAVRAPGTFGPAARPLEPPVRRGRGPRVTGPAARPLEPLVRQGPRPPESLNWSWRSSPWNCRSGGSHPWGLRSGAARPWA